MKQNRKSEKEWPYKQVVVVVVVVVGGWWW